MTWRTPDKLLEKGFDSYCTEVFTHSVLSALSVSSSWNPSISKLNGPNRLFFPRVKKGHDSKSQYGSGIRSAMFL